MKIKNIHIDMGEKHKRVQTYIYMLCYMLHIKINRNETHKKPQLVENHIKRFNS